MQNTPIFKSFSIIYGTIVKTHWVGSVPLTLII